jgi:hypothetical protein
MNEPEVLLFLRDPQYTGVRGRLVTMDTAAEDGRVCVLFEGHNRPIFALNELLKVEIFGAAVGRSMSCQARVLQHRAGSGVAFYVLELPPEQREGLEDLLERRGSTRVRPAVVAPIEATLSAPDGSLVREAVVKDLSVSGAGLLVRPPEELELLACSGLLLKFVLPGEGLLVELRVNLASRRPAGAMLHYGVSFDSVATQGFRELRARIGDWVAQRSAGSLARRVV